VSALAMQVQAPDQSLTAVPVPLEPAPAGWVRVAVAAAGICGADLGTVSAGADSSSPVTPGHEVAGTIAELGPGVAGWSVGDRVAVGWFGGSCGHCDACRHGEVVHCPDRQIPGISYPGGWAESITVPAGALARVPDGLDLLDAAPMGCAGVTTFNAVRRAGVPVGGRVAVHGLGGLGHLAVQWAAAMGYEVTVITRGGDRREAALQLGAAHYLDSTTTPVGQTLRAAGGMHAVISTAPTPEPVPELLSGLRHGGRLVLLGAAGGTFEVPLGDLVMNARTVSGHLTGSPVDTEEAMQLALVTGVRPVIERAPLTDAAQAVQRLRDGKVRFRTVLQPAG